MKSPHVILLDNHDSFVYNLVDALADFDTTVFRNTVSVKDVLHAQPDTIVLSPGPGHPRDAGCMMELVGATLGTIPILGICLGFQALLEHHGGTVTSCGPVHGKSVPMVITEAGCTDIPQGMRSLAHAATDIGKVTMAAETTDGLTLGMQFHPESILTPSGPLMLARCINQLSISPTIDSEQ